MYSTYEAIIESTGFDVLTFAQFVDLIVSHRQNDLKRQNPRESVQETKNGQGQL